MRKWKALLKSIILSFLLYMWFLGSSLLIKIDTHQVREAREKASLLQQFAVQKKWTSKVENLTRNVHSYCSVVQEQNRILKSHSDGITANETFLRAKREKGIRDNLIYIPELNQLWCLVPKVHACINYILCFIFLFDEYFCNRLQAHHGAVKLLIIFLP